MPRTNMTSKLALDLEPLVAAGFAMPWWNDDRARHCAYCGRMMRLRGKADVPTRATRDHVVPICHGGPNLTVPACLECNRTKGALSLPEFMAGDYLRHRRTPKHGKAWADHELWAVFSVASLRRTHELMRTATINAGAPVPSSPRQGRQGSADTSGPPSAGGSVQSTPCSASAVPGSG